MLSLDLYAGIAILQTSDDLHRVLSLGVWVTKIATFLFGTSFMICRDPLTMVEAKPNQLPTSLSQTPCTEMV